jgi:hypothetical protein
VFNLDEIIDYATSDQTKLSSKAISMEGMSSFYVRNLLNKSVSYPNVKYLEIGAWKGSTFYSALHNNKPDYALAIDSFCTFGGPEKEFRQNMSDVGANFEFLNQDCFTVDVNNINHKFNVYFYDGEHTHKDQELALTHYYNVLDNTFLFICDDYNWPQVQSGTKEGILKNNLKILDERTLLSNHNGDTTTWWNGLYVAVLSK